MRLTNYTKLILLNIIIFLILFEFISHVLIKLKAIPKYPPPFLALEAHREFSYWHPIKIDKSQNKV